MRIPIAFFGTIVIAIAVANHASALSLIVFEGSQTSAGQVFNSSVSLGNVLADGPGLLVFNATGDFDGTSDFGDSVEPPGSANMDERDLTLSLNGMSLKPLQDQLTTPPPPGVTKFVTDNGNFGNPTLGSQQVTAVFNISQAVMSSLVAPGTLDLDVIYDPANDAVAGLTGFQVIFSYSVVPVPEPGTLSLLCLGGLLTGFRRRRPACAD